MGFEQISFETVYRAGFNYWEPSYGYAKGASSGEIFHTQLPDSDINIIVVQLRRSDDKRTRTDLYFGSFRGKHTGQCESEQDPAYKAFWRNVKAVTTRPNRIATRDLEETILSVVEKHERTLSKVD